jgi:rSAM/selenodomain-associated transferase 1
MNQVMKYPDSIILVFAKAPVAGQVNTRLVPFISAQEAADLHKQFTRDRLQMCTAADLCEVQLWCSPDTTHRFFSDCRERFDIKLQTQHGNDLGERMSNAIRFMLDQYKKIIIIGTDAPALDIDTIANVINELDNRDAVLVPAEDGGYVLLGVSSYHQQLLANVPWGTEEVLSTTLENIDSLGMKYSLVGTCWDVDRPEDLQRYIDLKM